MKSYRTTILIIPFIISLVSSPEVAAAPMVDKTLPVASIRADFEELYQTLQAAHYNLFINTPKTEYDRIYKATLADLNKPMTLLETKVLFQRFVAAGHIAHANIAFPAEEYSAYQQHGGTSFPFSIKVSKNNVYILENYSGENKIAHGDQLVSLNNIALSYWLKLLKLNLSADNDAMADAFMEFRFPALLWLELGPQKQFDIVIRNKQGNVEKFVVMAKNPTEIQAAAAQQPKFATLDWNERKANMLDSSIAYLRPGPFYNNLANAKNMWDTTDFTHFIDDSFDSFLKANAKALIIDLRNNPGGDNSFSDIMLSWFANKPFSFVSDFVIKVSQPAINANKARLESSPTINGVSTLFAKEYAAYKPGDTFSFAIPYASPRSGQRFDKKVFVLINRHSYSNAVTVAAICQDYDFATIIGEATSDLATTYGAGEQFTLTNTGITVTFPKAHIIRPNGDKKPGGVIPDIAIETPLQASLNDAVLDQTVAIIQDKLTLK